jgi:hypothetical protein
MDFSEQEEKTRSFELDNGNKLNLTRTDPYGAIVLSLEHGQLPDALKGGSYTSWDHAEIAAKAYIDERRRVQERAAELAARPKIKYKFDPKKK